MPCILPHSEQVIDDCSMPMPMLVAVSVLDADADADG
jgi:hypothetical protein